MAHKQSEEISGVEKSQREEEQQVIDSMLEDLEKRRVLLANKTVINQQWARDEFNSLGDLKVDNKWTLKETKEIYHFARIKDKSVNLGKMYGKGIITYEPCVTESTCLATRGKKTTDEVKKEFSLLFTEKVRESLTQLYNRFGEVIGAGLKPATEEHEDKRKRVRSPSPDDDHYGFKRLRNLSQLELEKSERYY